MKRTLVIAATCVAAVALCGQGARSLARVSLEADYVATGLMCSIWQQEPLPVLAWSAEARAFGAKLGDRFRGHFQEHLAALRSRDPVTTCSGVPVWPKARE